MIPAQIRPPHLYVGLVRCDYGFKSGMWEEQASGTLSIYENVVSPRLAKVV